MSQRAGWYDDPEDPDQLRYFDGVVWTTHTTPRTSPTAAQSTIGRAQQPAASPDATQQIPTPYGQPPQAGGYGQPPQAPQYGQPPQAPQYGPYGPQGQYGQPPAGGYGTMPPAYAAALGGKTTPDGVPLASYGQRVGAYLIDAVIHGILGALLSWPWLSQAVQAYTSWIEDAINTTPAGATPSTTALVEELTGYIVPISLVGLLVGVVYQVAFLVWRGATPGKMALGIRVRLREREGNPSVLVALKRQLITIGTTLIGLLPAIGILGNLVNLLDLLWPLWDDKRQALHDKIAETNVVVRRRGR